MREFLSVVGITLTFVAFDPYPRGLIRGTVNRSR